MVEGGLTERLASGDLHSDLGRRDDGVVRVGLVTRVHATLHGLARSIEGGLGDGVVLSKELEDDHITDRNVVKLLRLVDQAIGATNDDGVTGRRLRRVDSRRSGVLAGGSDSLGDRDLFIVGCGLDILTTGVTPDDDDFCLGVGSEALALHAVDEVVLVRELLDLLVLLGDLRNLLMLVDDLVLINRSGSEVTIKLGNVAAATLDEVTVTLVEVRASP